MSEEARQGLAESDKGSYYQEWSSDTPEEEESFGATRQKILRTEERGSVKIWSTDLENTDDSKSSDDCDDDAIYDESLSETLNLLDAQLLQDALKDFAFDITRYKIPDVV